MKKKFLQLSVFFAAACSLAVSSVTAQWNKVGPYYGCGFNVFCLKSMGTDLYAGGTGIAKWDGTTWTDLGRVAPSSPLGAGSLGINTMVVFSGELYAAGDFDSLGGVHIDPAVGVAKFNGTTWQQVGTSAPNLSGVTRLVVYHNELYAGGNYGVNKWDGTTWTSVGTVNGPSNVVLAVYHDQLYAAGNFSHIGTATMTEGKGFAKYDGTTWTALPGFYDTLSALPGVNVAKAAGMIVFKDELYVIGSLDYAGSLFVRGVARWNGTTWNTTNGGITGNGELSPNCMSADSNFLYVVGPIQKANSTNDSIYLSTYWDGTKWNQMFGGTAPYTSFFATENYKGGIYSSYSYLAKWVASSAVTEMNNKADLAHVYPNPASGIIHLALNNNGPLQISVSNALGQTVYHNELMKPAADEVIDLGRVPAGIYFLSLTGSKGTQIKKIQITK